MTSSDSGVVGTLPDEFIPISATMLNKSMHFDSGIPSVRFSIGADGTVTLIQNQQGSWRENVLGATGESGPIPAGIVARPNPR